MSDEPAEVIYTRADGDGQQGTYTFFHDEGPFTVTENEVVNGYMVHRETVEHVRKLKQKMAGGAISIGIENLFRLLGID